MEHNKCKELLLSRHAGLSLVRIDEQDQSQLFQTTATHNDVDSTNVPLDGHGPHRSESPWMSYDADSASDTRRNSISTSCGVIPPS